MYYCLLRELVYHLNLNYTKFRLAFFRGFIMPGGRLQGAWTQRSQPVPTRRYGFCAPRTQRTSQDHADLATDIHAPCRQRGFAHLFDVPRLCGTESLPSTSALFQGCALLTSWIFKHNILTTPSTATAVATWWTRRIASARLLSTARVLFALPALARHLCT